jgi:hypothetical protein
MKQAIISIAIIACMMVAAIPPFNSIEHAEAEDIPTFEPQSVTWFDGGWGNRKEITISNPVEDYQSLINISKSSGGDVSCEGHCNDNFSDIRFACANGTLLPYWIQEKTDGTECVVWVNNTFNDSTIYLYYNNTAAISASNATETFISFVDCETEPDFQDIGSRTFMIWDADLGEEKTEYRFLFNFEVDTIVKHKYGSSTSYCRYQDDGTSTYNYFLTTYDTDATSTFPAMTVRGDSWKHPFSYDTKYWVLFERNNQNLKLYKDGVPFASSSEGDTMGIQYFSAKLATYSSPSQVTYEAAYDRLRVQNYRSDGWASGRYERNYIYDIAAMEGTSGDPPTFSFGDEELPIQILSPSPANNTVNISGLMDEWSCYISSNAISSGTIECNNGDTMSWTDESEGTKTLSFSEYLDYNTTYTVWVNVTASGQTVEDTFNFKTMTCKINGTIAHEYWGGVENVQVVANNSNTEYTTYTDSNGFYEFDDVSYGAGVEYNITANKFAYTFTPEYKVEDLTRNVSNANFTAVHYFFKGDGSTDDPFTIRNCTHLNNTRLFLNYSFVLNNDLDLSEYNVEQWNGGDGFEPLGNETVPFTGMFDGGGYVISSLYSTYSSTDHNGLFGYVEDADIRNLGLENANISGGDYTGSLAGYMNNSSILRCFSQSNKSIAGNNYAGGLVGVFENGSITDAYARINTTGTTIGGLCGSVVDSTVNLTYATGDVTGGGGLIGSQSGATINNSYFDNETAGTTTSDGGTGKNTENMTSQDFWDTTIFTFPSIWFLDENQNDNYPILSIFTEITPPLLRNVNYAGSKTQQLTRYLNSSFNPEDYCFFNVTAYVPSERYIGRWNKNVSDKYFIATGDITPEPDYNDTENNYVLASKYTCDYTGYYSNIRVFTVWHGMYPAHIGAAVCSDNNDEPGEVLGTTDAYTIVGGRDEIWFPDTSHVWIELNLTEPVFMAKDTDYWLMATSNDSSMWRESKYGDYNLSTYSDFAWLLGRADGPSTDNVKRLAYNVTLDVPNKEYVDPYAGTAWAGMYGYWKADVQNASFEWPSTFAGESWSQGVDSMTTELNETAEPVPLTELLIYATTTVDVSPVNITQVEMTWGTGQGDDVVWDDPINMSRVSPNLNYWEYNKTNLPGGEWNTWMITLYDEFGNIESYDYYRYLKHGITERITFQVNASNPSESDPFKEITSETDLYSSDWVFYLYEADYDDTMYIYGDNEGRKQVLRHEQGVDGSSTDSGYWRTDEPTDEFQERTCAFFVGGAFDENVAIPDGVTINNAVLVWWLASGRQIEGAYWAPPYNDVGTNFHWGRADPESSYDEFYIRDLGFGQWRSKMYDAEGDTLAWQTFPQTRRYLNDWINFEEEYWYGDDTPSFDNSTGRLTNYMGRQMVGKIDFSTLAGTDYPNTFDSNSIYQLLIGLDYDAAFASGPNAAIFNNRSHPSFVMFNVPDNATLKTTDSSNDGITDYEKIYKYGLHPFWTDTDNDSFTDIQELSRDCAANLYREYPSDSNIILLKNMTPMKGNDTKEWEKTLRIEVENPNAQTMDVKWYALRNFTFNSSYRNQDQLLEGYWELIQTNSSVSDGTYSLTYEPGAGDNYVAVNASDGSGWWGNRTFEFSGPDRQINGTITFNGSGLSQVEVTAELNGDTYTTYTDENGSYLLTNLTGGNYTITPSYTEMCFIPETETIYVSTENLTIDFQAIEPPKYWNETPLSNSTDVNNNVEWSTLIEYNTTFNWTIECSNGAANSSTEDTTGRKKISLSNLVYGTEYVIYVNASHATYPHVQTNEIYTFTVREERIMYPQEPQKFVASSNSFNHINLQWDMGTDAEYTYIRYKEGSTPPANRVDGIFLYEGTGNETRATGLETDITYAFSAWSYNEEFDSWSYLVSDTAKTILSSMGQTSIANNSKNIANNVEWSIDLINPIGEFFNWTIECSNGQSTGQDGDTNGTKSLQLSNLDFGAEYTVWVNMTYNPTISRWYTFETQDQPENEDYIDVVLSPQAEANIVVNRTEWMPSIGITQNESTTTAWANIDNNGSVSVSVNVTVSDTTNWTAATAPGHNQFNMSIYTGSEWLIMGNVEQVFVTNLGYNEDQDFGLQLYMPTSSETNTNQTATITFVATAD